MKILVAIKRVPDYATKVKVTKDGLGIETQSIKWIANPFDEIAVEEAVRLKEQGIAQEVVVVSIGPEDVTSQLRYGLAMGADSAILVRYNGPADSDLAARLLGEVWKRGSYDLMLMGKQSIDSDSSQTAQLLAAQLDLPQACFASKIVPQGKTCDVTREVDGGLETVRVSLPAVISTDLRLNEPRYASLPGIMKAKKKPLEIIEAESLGVELKTAVKILKMSPPAARQAGKKVGSVAELVAVLKDKI
jgi:electron transfer flavoprotein beta subunit